jgi:hypothetical protein
MNKSTQFMPAAIPLYFVATVIETVINCSPENDDLSLPGSNAVIWQASPDILKQRKLLPQRHSVTFQGIKYSATLLSESQISHIFRTSFISRLPIKSNSEFFYLCGTIKCPIMFICIILSLTLWLCSNMASVILQIHADMQKN